MRILPALILYGCYSGDIDFERGLRVSEGGDEVGSDGEPVDLDTEDQGSFDTADTGVGDDPFGTPGL